jgi:hypothetical protein
MWNTMRFISLWTRHCGGATNKPVVREHMERVYDAFEALEATLDRELAKKAAAEAR